MPQLSPLNWVLSFILALFFSSLLVSLFWWRQALSFPLLVGPSHSTKPPTWKWS